VQDRAQAGLVAQPRRNRVVVVDVEPQVMDVVGAPVARERLGVGAPVVERLDQLDAHAGGKRGERHAHCELGRTPLHGSGHVRGVLRPDAPRADAVAVRPAADRPVEVGRDDAEVVEAGEHPLDST
jgi:hypothetical protein